MGLGNYIKETRGELKHVSWPTRSQALAFTIIVVVISVGLSLFLGLFDFLFSRGLQFLITRF
ncbi:preprotein translocase subunit SecE [Candidatus Parcubacteria bacterium]|nr:preprotein translocase subunit SecE [Candidatus Parcubacteria bacterium]